MLNPAARRPRRVVARTLGFGLSALVAAGLLAWSPAATTGWSQGAAESTLWQLLNGARSNNGMAPLQQNGTLVGLARWRSSDMLAKNYFSHTIAGCGCLVYAYYDSSGLRYNWAGENIGWNSGLDDSYSPVRVHEKFMASPGHRANVLDRSFTHGGVGAAAADGKMFQGYVQNTRMYTELFMQAAGTSAPPPPSGGGGGGTGGGGSGGGGTGGGGGSGYTAPAAQVAVAPPKPTAKRVTVSTPQRPTSTAGFDGIATLVSAPNGTERADHLLADETAAVRIAAMAGSTTAGVADAAPAVAADTMQVAAAHGANGGPFDGIIGAVLGFLFG